MVGTLKAGAMSPGTNPLEFGPFHWKRSRGKESDLMVFASAILIRWSRGFGKVENEVIR